MPALSYSQDFQYEFSGTLIEQPTYLDIKSDNLLNPDREIIDFSHWVNRFYVDLNLDASYSNFSLKSKYRPEIFSQEGTSDILSIFDDFYLDISLRDNTFLYLGKRNIRDGVAIGFNPTDFLGEDKEVDFIKREEERRIERRGNYLVGIDTFLKNITLSFLYSPRINGLQEQRNRYLFKSNFFLESYDTDISLHLYDATTPGIGFNVSTTIGRALVMYTETAFRRGSPRDTVKVSERDTKNIMPDKFKIVNRTDFNNIYPHIVAGGHYTFKDGTNIICEYYYNGDGFNGKEASRFRNFVKESNDNFKQNYFKEIMRFNLLQANEIIKFREYRRNYLFARISNPNIKEKIDGASAFIFNLDDGSFLVNPTIDYKISENTTIGFSSISFFGNKDAEFGLTPWNSSFSLIYKYYF